MRAYRGIVGILLIMVTMLAGCGGESGGSSSGGGSSNESNNQTQSGSRVVPQWYYVFIRTNNNSSEWGKGGIESGFRSKSAAEKHADSYRAKWANKGWNAGTLAYRNQCGCFAVARNSRAGVGVHTNANSACTLALNECRAKGGTSCTVGYRACVYDIR